MCWEEVLVEAYLYLREVDVIELDPLGSGRHPSHSATPAGPGDEVARGIAGEKFDIVKKWGINTYKVGFKHLCLKPPPFTFFLSFTNPYTPYMTEIPVGEAGC